MQRAGLNQVVAAIAALVIVGGGVSVAPGVASAGRPDPVAGEQMAKVKCAACHGLDGISLVANYPNLRGQKVKYLIKQLKDFRSGERQSPNLMNPVAIELTDDDIKNLAAFFSSLGQEDAAE